MEIMDFRHEELKLKIEQEFELGVPYLGSYNTEKRREDVLSKVRDILEALRENDDEQDDPSITDPVHRKLNLIQKKVKKLESAVDRFEGPHFNVKFRQLVEQCTNYQIELNFSSEDKGSDGQRRMALVQLNEISDRLFSKIHRGEKCADCS